MTDSTPATAATVEDAKAQLAAQMDVRAAVIRAVEIGFSPSHVRAIVARTLFDVCEDPDG